jgi:hypothetical protein
VTPDLLAVAERISDPAFFTGAAPQEQRALFGAVLESLQVDRSGAVHAQPRSW